MTYRRFAFRQGTAAEWTSRNPVLAKAEPGLEIGVGLVPKVKYGDGTTAWVDLPYAGSGSGDITSGTAAPTTNTPGSLYLQRTTS